MVEAREVPVYRYRDPTLYCGERYHNGYRGWRNGELAEIGTGGLGWLVVFDGNFCRVGAR